MKQSRIEREKVTIERMVRIYCRKKEKNESLCPGCEELIAYTHQRLDRCPFGEEKTACKDCPVHCYKPVMREKVRRVMRYVGPRMIYLAPVDFMRHLFGK
ncbi:putative amidophosphoribosyltransferase [Parabacteroides sp. PFB2-12]|uniref:nitrous oxide-stimulated promoter family protein n=1 Tax=unclassified Parabacteroides TaxID=2649774 RepID=UPI0024734A68|nr:MULTISPECIES: nitrous oxide-stimulated promoter family protein [unclassified Parabacteroides]MDH6343829.1 putative amidophosphoribosyltransferase [Parabacteroides sp. PM6-13]MDH6391535.1 putative amidophosphoribosyltransferase [Parabacteroides sp. PFB2-12]